MSDSLADDSQEQRWPGRYEVTGPDGTRWVVAWVQDLGTFSAEEQTEAAGDAFSDLVPTPLAHDIPTLGVLRDVIGQDLPDDVLVALSRGRVTFPEPDPRPRAPWYLRRQQMLDDPGFGPLWQKTLARYVQETRDGPQPRTTLPTAPVSRALEQLWEEAGRPHGHEDALGFAMGLGLEEDLATRILYWRTTELDGEEIAQVCAALRCSPFDLWGSDRARAALGIYPPDHWPSHIEPLDDGRPSRPYRLLRELVDRQAEERLRPTADGGDPVVTGLDEDTTLDSVTITAYQRVAVLEKPPWGPVRRLQSGNVPASADAEYYLAFRQIDEPTPMTSLPLDALLNGHGTTHAGWDVQPALAAAAEQYRFTSPDGADGHVLTARDHFELVRFTPTDGDEVWLHWDDTTRSWELAQDPRTVYPGNPGDVIDHSSYTDPRPLPHLDDPQDGVPTWDQGATGNPELTPLLPDL